MGVVLRQAWSKSQWTVLMGYCTISTNFSRYQTHHRWHFSFRKTAHWCTCIVHATQSNCCGALDFLSPEPCPQHPELNALITRLRESYSNVWVVSQKDWRNRGPTSSILAMHWYIVWVKKCDFRVSRFCQVVQKHKLFGKASFDCLLIGNIFVSDIAIFVLKRDVKLQLTN